jgi:hypothetical protein
MKTAAITGTAGELQESFEEGILGAAEYFRDFLRIPA